MSTSGTTAAVPGFWSIIYNHRAKLTVIGMVAFSTFVHSLPTMIHSKHGFVVWLYNWFYTFAHALSGGLGHTTGGDL